MFPLSTFPIYFIFFLQQSLGLAKVERKAPQACSARSSLDFKRHRRTVDSTRVRDQYPAGKLILFHVYYRPRRGSMHLQKYGCISLSVGSCASGLKQPHRWIFPPQSLTGGFLHGCICIIMDCVLEHVLWCRQVKYIESYDGTMTVQSLTLEADEVLCDKDVNLLIWL